MATDEHLDRQKKPVPVVSSDRVRNTLRLNITPRTISGKQNPFEFSTL